jgi:hypothetical protein
VKFIGIFNLSRPNLAVEPFFLKYLLTIGFIICYPLQYCLLLLSFWYGYCLGSRVVFLSVFSWSFSAPVVLLVDQESVPD